MNKIINYFLEVKSELAKVVWPSRQTTVRYTLIVIAFALVVAIILGSADYGLTQFISKIVNR
jgi:preprotein translocase subunit SecE